MGVLALCTAFDARNLKTILCGVIRVDTDIFRGKIRGPEAAHPRSEIEIDMNRQIALLQIVVRCRLVKVG